MSDDSRPGVRWRRLLQYRLRTLLILTTLLAIWLGHSDATHTYWYLTATGELMTLAAGKLESIAEGEPS